MIYLNPLIPVKAKQYFTGKRLEDYAKATANKIKSFSHTVIMDCPTTATGNCKKMC